MWWIFKSYCCFDPAWKPPYMEELLIHSAVNLRALRTVLCCTCNVAFTLNDCAPISWLHDQAHCHSAVAEPAASWVLANATSISSCFQLKTQQEFLMWTSILWDSGNDEQVCSPIRKFSGSSNDKNWVTLSKARVYMACCMWSEAHSKPHKNSILKGTSKSPNALFTKIITETIS